jgi:hypothetical protein
MFMTTHAPGNRFKRPDNCSFRTEAPQYIAVHIPAGDAALVIQDLKRIADAMEGGRRPCDLTAEQRKGIERRRRLADMLAAQWGAGR